MFHWPEKVLVGQDMIRSLFVKVRAIDIRIGKSARAGQEMH